MQGLLDGSDLSIDADGEAVDLAKVKPSLLFISGRVDLCCFPCY